MARKTVIRQVPKKLSDLKTFRSDSNVAWIEPGKQLKVGDVILRVKRCDIRFSNFGKSLAKTEDSVCSVEFCFRKAVPNSAPFVYNFNNQFVPLAEEDVDKVPKSHKLWVVQVFGKTAKAVKQAYIDLRYWKFEMNDESEEEEEIDIDDLD